MRKITQQITAHFLTCNPANIGNSHTDGKALYLHGNKIAEYRDGQLHITAAGWKTNTTKERLNALPGVSINQKAGQWYLNGEPWDGTWTAI